MAEDDEVPQLTQDALELCRALQPGNPDVADQVRRAAELAKSGGAAEAFKAAAKALALAMHGVAEAISGVGLELSVEKIDRLEATARLMCMEFRDQGDRESEAYALHARAVVYLAMSDSVRAAEACSRAAATFKKLGRKIAEAAVYSTAADVYIVKASANTLNSKLDMSLKKEEKAEAMREYQESTLELATEMAKKHVEMKRMMNDKEGEALGLLKLSQVYRHKEENDEAREIARDAQAMYSVMDDVDGESRALRAAIDASLEHEDDWDDAVRIAEELLATVRQKRRGEGQREAEALHVLAQVQLHVGDLEDAQASAKSALELFQQAGALTNGVCPVRNTMALIKFQLGEHKDAVDEMFRAAKVFKDSGDKAGEAEAIYKACDCDLESFFQEVEKNPKVFTDEQQKHLNDIWPKIMRSLTLYKELRDDVGEARVYRLIQENFDKAKKVHQRQVEPSKTVWYWDENTRQCQGFVNHWDVEPDAMRKKAQQLEDGGDDYGDDDDDDDMLEDA